MRTVVIFDYGVGNLHSLSKAFEARGAAVRIQSDPETVLDGDALVLPGVGAFGAAAARLAPALPAIRAALANGFPCLGICLGMQLLFEASDEGVGRGIGALPGRVRRLEAVRVPHMGWNAVELVSRVDPLLNRNIGGMWAFDASMEPRPRHGTPPESARPSSAFHPAPELRPPPPHGKLTSNVVDVPSSPVPQARAREPSRSAQHLGPVQQWLGRRPGPRHGKLAAAESPVAYFAHSYIVEPADPTDVIAWTEHEGKRFPAAVRRGHACGVQFHPEKSGTAGLHILGNFLAGIRS